MTIADFEPELAPVSGEDPPAEETKPVTELINGLEGNTLRIIVIIALAVPALIIVFILFRPSRGRKEKYYDS